MARRFSRSPRRPRSRREDSRYRDEPPDIPFWEHGPEKDLEFADPSGDVLLQFQAALVVPDGQALGKSTRDHKYPLLVYFSGLGFRDGLRDLGMDKLRRLATTPFVVAAPMRTPGRWWVLDSDQEPWGFVDGAFLKQAAQDFVEWIQVLSQESSIHPEWISLVGFSAGAYAAIEVMCANRNINFRGCLLGGVHGHGQSEATIDEVKRKRGVSREVALQRWSDFEQRIKTIGRPPDMILAVHHPEDQVCPWTEARRIYSLLNARRRSFGLPAVEVDLIVGMPKTKKNKTLHNYRDRAVFRAAFFRRLLPTSHGASAQRHVLDDDDWEYEPADLGQLGFQDIMRSTILAGEGKSPEQRPKGTQENAYPWRRGRAPHEDRGFPSRRGGERRPQHDRSRSRSRESPSPVHPSRGAALSQRESMSKRAGLMCASPGCYFLVHSDPEFGGFCCRKCYWRYDTGSKTKKKHGELCEHVQAPPDAPRSEPIPPDE